MQYREPFGTGTEADSRDHQRGLQCERGPTSQENATSQDAYYITTLTNTE